MNDLLIKALKDIIEECPKPKLPYGMKVVEIAKKALKDNSSGGYLDALLDAVRRKLKEFEDDIGGRLEFMEKIKEGYCQYCGRDDGDSFPRCQCWNNE